jgi:hypothetical protein
LTTAAEELFVGLDHAETQVPERWVGRFERARERVVLVALVALQVGWLGAFLYAAYRFV